MKTLPDLNLPSNPDIVIRMREATVADSIDFAGVQEGLEETVTTLFLDRVQDKATYSNPKKWTGEDRRLALYWYWLHTAKDTSIPLTFDCSVCGESHTKLVDMMSIAEHYKRIKGKPERDILDGSVIVHPFNGEDLEAIEMKQMELLSVAKEKGENSGEAGLLNARLQLYQVVRCIRFKEETDKDDPVKFREKKIMGMGHTEFTHFSSEVFKAIGDMEHGLRSEYDNGVISLLVGPVKCADPEKEKEDGTLLRVRFRNYDYIPVF